MPLKPVRQVYVEELHKKGLGLPLWFPESVEQRAGPLQAQIGDVGFVSRDDGVFYRLFNACKTRDHPWNDDLAPQDFEPLVLDDRHVKTVENNLKAGAYVCTSNAERQDQAHAGISSLAPITAGFNFSFSSQVHRAAVLVLKPWANFYHSLQHETIKNYCLKYGESWYDFAKSQGFALDPGEIILVYGVVRTATWALAAFTENDTKMGAGVSLDTASFAGAGISLYRAWDERSSVEHRSGPPTKSHKRPSAEAHIPWSLPSPPVSLRTPADSLSRNEVSAGKRPLDEDWNFDQTIFLRHYVVKPRMFRTPKVMRGAADPKNVDSSGDDSDSSLQSIQSSTQCSSSVEVARESDIGPTHYGLHVLLDHLLESQPSARAAVACDDEFYHTVKGVSDVDLTTYFRQAEPRTFVRNGSAALSVDKDGFPGHSVPSHQLVTILSSPGAGASGQTQSLQDLFTKLPKERYASINQPKRSLLSDLFTPQIPVVPLGSAEPQRSEDVKPDTIHHKRPYTANSDSATSLRFQRRNPSLAGSGLYPIHPIQSSTRISPRRTSDSAIGGAKQLTSTRARTQEVPFPAQLAIPRTTRRQMLNKELTEAERKDLLWERRRRGSDDDGRKGGSQLPSPILVPRPILDSRSVDRVDTGGMHTRLAVMKSRSWGDNWL
ncbi:hypothetical protein PUNSTDRAFT_133702 [Punctularia strigosozonata HHB-11173 SS5]|uniref:uncharacterized protein n=1 Tax=Punctularia strigosozonata (strain HHB-11173) TaxID=741275 RepID=UPI00044185C2|nr:uncharacterized protein PUNSTDRAFT_133702 [Punctularia strigosozonata HHB-11173 SS5]EIN09929.1 hypothetical protein PUNSTDRAFT_133702 [Punctularia strigosozonata HHB-11173 SS5]